MCEYKNIFRCEECPHYMDDCDGDENNFSLSLNELKDMYHKLINNNIVSISSEGVHMTSEAFFEKFADYKVKQGRGMVWVSQHYKGVKFFALANKDELERELRF